MRTVRVIFSNGDTITTSINGTDDQIRDYYSVGRWFNLGNVEDLMVTVTGLEFV